MNLVPYTSSGDLPAVLAPAQLVPIGAGEYSAVHMTVEVSALEMFIATIENWFGNREDVIFVGSGVSSKQNIGFIILEWEECEIDQLFLDILETTDFVVDYSVYVRSEDV